MKGFGEGQTRGIYFPKEIGLTVSPHDGCWSYSLTQLGPPTNGSWTESSDFCPVSGGLQRTLGHQSLAMPILDAFNNPTATYARTFDGKLTLGNFLASEPGPAAPRAQIFAVVDHTDAYDTKNSRSGTMQLVEVASLTVGGNVVSVHHLHEHYEVLNVGGAASVTSDEIIDNDYWVIPTTGLPVRWVRSEKTKVTATQASLIQEMVFKTFWTLELVSFPKTNLDAGDGGG